MEIVRSKNNLFFKQWLQSAKRKGDWGRAYFLEGTRLCYEALKSTDDWQIVAVAFSETALENAEIKNIYNVCSGEEFSARIQIMVLSDNLFNQLGDTVNPQGVCMLVLPVRAMQVADLSRVLVLECIQDPGNLGTIWRSADAFGFDAVIITAGGVLPNNRKVLRSAMGSVFHVPIFIVDEIATVYKNLRSEGFWLAAADLKGQDVNNFLPNNREKVALIIGNEGRGLSEFACTEADANVFIPIGRAESLNAGCAAGILCYLFRR